MGERLRDDRGVVPEGGVGDAGAERDLPRLRPQAGERDPGVSGGPSFAIQGCVWSLEGVRNFSLPVV